MHVENWDALAGRAVRFPGQDALGQTCPSTEPTGVTWLSTERFVLRSWRDDDLGPYAALNADPRHVLCAAWPTLRSGQTCRPHSVLVDPAHRPERGSSPGATRRVHGAQPIEG